MSSPTSRRGRLRWSPAMKRHQMRVWPTLAVYAVVLTLVIRLFGSHPPTGVLRYLAAAAPAIPLMGLIVINARYLVEETDEFRRLTMMLSMLCGLAAALAVTSVWGFLEVLAGVPMVPLYHVATIYVVAQGLSAPVIAWRYR
ncbi:hypothetical protein [Phenylobacterium sp.]|uniref:hypothetical protein n=1 Tax=Phenylobacterium sp. TaxID=1871053 RepID=UPI003568CC56